MKIVQIIALSFLFVHPALAQERTENKRLSVIFDFEAGYGVGKGINTMAQIGSGLHFVLRNNFAFGVQGELGFLGGLKKPDALSTYNSQSLVVGKVIPTSKNWTIYPYVGVGRYNAIETTDVADTLLNDVTGLLGSSATRYTTHSISNICIPFGVKLYRAKKKFGGFYLGANGFYAFNGSYAIFGNLGFAFGGRKRMELENPVSIKPDFAFYSGPALIGDKSTFGFNHGVDVNFFIHKNFYVGFDIESMAAMNQAEQIAKIYTPIKGVSGDLKLGLKTNLSEKTSVLIGLGLNIQSLTKTTNQRVESILDIPFFEEEEEQLEYTTQKVKNLGFMFEAMFRSQFGDSHFSLVYGSQFSVSKESTYNLKIGLGYSIK